jgi:hypothetical protein
MQLHPATQEMAEAATRLLASLSAQQRAEVIFEFDDVERGDWHYVPRARAGLPLKGLTAEQRLLAHALLASGLSSRATASSNHHEPGSCFERTGTRARPGA